MNTDPVAPGPFEKYLFSGACYVSLGQSYLQLVECLMRGGSESDMDAIQGQLVDIWHEALNHHLMMAGVLLDSPLIHQQPEIRQKLDTYLAEARKMAMEDMGPLLASFRSDRTHIPDFQEFFQVWMEACDRIWDNLIRSEWFSDLIGLIVNGCIEIATNGKAP